jgi:hypothetical protein
MAIYLVMRESVYLEKMWVKADSVEEARQKAIDDDYEDITDLDYLKMCDNPDEWEITEG